MGRGFLYAFADLRNAHVTLSLWTGYHTWRRGRFPRFSRRPCIAVSQRVLPGVLPARLRLACRNPPPVARGYVGLAPGHTHLPWSHVFNPTPKPATVPAR